MSMKDVEPADAAAPKRKLACTPAFDALYFCYSPVHQVQQYYRTGFLDDCTEKWRNFYDCMILKTKRAAVVQEVLEKREKEKKHIWTFRTPEEAAAFWKKEFGHLDDRE